MDQEQRLLSELVEAFEQVDLYFEEYQEGQTVQNNYLNRQLEVLSLCLQDCLKSRHPKIWNYFHQNILSNLQPVLYE